MVDKIVSTRDDTEQQAEAHVKSKTYLQLVRDKKKRKKKKKRTKDKCSQKKERKATQTLAIVLGGNFHRFIALTQQISNKAYTLIKYDSLYFFEKRTFLIKKNALLEPSDENLILYLRN